MTKRTAKVKDAPDSLQNGAFTKSDHDFINVVISKLDEKGIKILMKGKKDISVSKYLLEFLKEFDVQKKMNLPGRQIKMFATHAHDDLLELLIGSMPVATKFYQSRTMKSSRQLRKTLLEVSKIALQERKVILKARSKKQNQG